MFDLSLLNGNCYINGNYLKTNIYITNGKIAEITDAVLPALDSYDCKDKNVFPGFVDPHVHFALNLGEFMSVDNFDTGTKAAAFGGVTTVIDFLDPINSNSDYRNMFNKRIEDAKESHIDYAFHCTLGNYLDNTDNLYKELDSDGITSIKVFTTYSESDRKCSYSTISRLLKTKYTILSHSEEDALVESDHKDVSTYEISRPESAEISAITKLAELVKKTKGKLYIVHTSSGHTIDVIKNDYFRLLNENLFLESCPHYFYLDKSNFKKEDGRKYLLAPPLRSRESAELLKQHISFIDTIATDHCAFMLDDKYRYLEADKVPKGIGSIEFSFILMYNLFGDDIIDKFTKIPASIFDLKTKGSLKVGLDADICIFDKEGETIVTSGHSESDYSVYEGMKLKGKIISTISRGKFIVKDNTFIGGKGLYVRREL